MIPPGDACGSLLQCAAATSSDMVTIAGADVFMNTSSCFAPGHKPLWRPLVSLGQNEQATKGPGDGLNKGFSVVFHEDLLGSCGGFRGEESGLDYPFSSFDLNNPFSQVCMWNAHLSQRIWPLSARDSSQNPYYAPTMSPFALGYMASTGLSIGPFEFPQGLISGQYLPLNFLQVVAVSQM